jgi:hypothetical protein
MSRGAPLSIAVLACQVCLADAVGSVERPSGMAVGPSGYRVLITMEDRNGQPLATLSAGEDLRLVITFAEAAGGKPVTGLKPLAWVRRIPPEGGPSCSSAAWAVRATGAISPDDIPLQRSFLITIGGEQDGSEDRLRVVDLSHNLRSANQVSVTPLGGKIAGLLVHPASPRAFATLPHTGEVIAVGLPWGDVARLAKGLDNPTALLPLGNDVLVLNGTEVPRLTRLDMRGTRLADIPTGPGPIVLQSPTAETALAVAADGSALLLRVGDGAVHRLSPGSVAAPVAAGGGAILATGPGSSITVRWVDNPDQSSLLPLPFRPDGLFMRDDGRFALAWSNAARQAVIVDLAGSRTLARISLPDEVDEVTSAGSALVLTHRHDPVASVIDLAPAIVGVEPVSRHVRLPVPGAASASQGGRLAGAASETSAVTVRPGSNVALMISAGGGLGDQPMSAVTVRGEFPTRIARFNQRLEEAAKGRFVAPLRLPSGGRYEVITTTGPGGATACAGFSVEGPDADAGPRPLLRLVEAPPRAGHRGTLKLALHDRPGWLAPGPVAMRVHDLEFGSSRLLTAMLSEQSILTAELTFPNAGGYALSIDAGSGEVSPLLLVVGP